MRNRDMPAHVTNVTGLGSEARQHYGLTKREAAAMHNMALLIAGEDIPPITNDQLRAYAHNAVRGADALFDELEKQEPARGGMAVPSKVALEGDQS